MNQLERLAIPELMEKNFFIPDYQRGYRWEKYHINQLLSDIWDFMNQRSGDFYCLQPIVVRECKKELVDKYLLNSSFDNNRWYEVIDGQQRLTTIRLIIEMNNRLSPLSAIDNCFKLYYQTKPELGSIFDKINLTRTSTSIEVLVDKSSIDSFYISDGFKNIIDWFTNPGLSYEKRATIQQFPSFFSTFFGEKSSKGGSRQGQSTQVIWYEVNENSESKLIFKRLNDTKIPLTNAELVKALFLSQSSEFSIDYDDKMDDEARSRAAKFDKAKKQNHIAKQWDTIEHTLGNDKLWGFVTNNNITDFNTKIELLFDLISGKSTKQERNNELLKKDQLYTYLYFDKLIREGRDLWDLWMLIEQYFETICYWFEDRDLYHKIGYLVCIKGDSILIDLLRDALSKNKDDFKSDLRTQITSTIMCDFSSMNYRENYEEIQRILILYNIETTRRLQNVEFYPFNLHKEKRWTLEHIHAQNSDNLNKDDQKSWFSWIEEHIIVLESLIRTDSISKNDKQDLGGIITDLKICLNNSKLDFQSFETQFSRVISFFNRYNNWQGKSDTVHLLSNMALLGGIENTVLSNSVFEAKRRKIISMDAVGLYIPICTRYVFLKYHNSNEADFSIQQHYFWGEKDGVNYLKHIRDILSEYIGSEDMSPINDNIKEHTIISNNE